MVKKEEEKRNKIVPVRFKDSEYEETMKIADDLGMEVSTYIRAAVIKENKKNKKK